MTDADPRSFSPRGGRALVLGGAGFIGRWVVDRASRRGAEVHAAVRDREAARAVFAAHGVEPVVHVADLSAPASVENLLAEVAPAAVLNLAGYGVDRAEREEGPARALNADLPARIARAAPPEARVVHAGSALEYGVARGDLAEDSRAEPTTLYGRTKLAGTRALAEVCRERGLAGLTARLFTVYGPGEHDGRLLPSLLAAASSGRPLDLTHGRQRRDFGFVADVADCLLDLAERPGEPGEVINVATGVLTPVREFVETAARVLGIPPERLRFGAVPAREEEMEHAPVAVRRLEARLGRRLPHRLEDGIRMTRELGAAR